MNSRTGGERARKGRPSPDPVDWIGIRKSAVWQPEGRTATIVIEDPAPHFGQLFQNTDTREFRRTERCGRRHEFDRERTADRFRRGGDAATVPVPVAIANPLAVQIDFEARRPMGPGSALRDLSRPICGTDDRLSAYILAEHR